MTPSIIGRITKMTDEEGRVIRFEYDGVGNLIKTTHSNGVVEENTYNKVDNLVVRVQKKDEEVIERTEYTYDAAGNITAVSESNAATEDKSVLKNAVMTYDEDNRLLTYNGEEIQYDADGNMTYGPLNGVMTEFAYDSRNRLIRAGETTYEYDAEDNRIAVETENYRDEYVLDVESTYSQMLVAERTYTDGREETSLYVYGNGLIGEEKTTDETAKTVEYATYLYNHLGSTTAVTDENGAVIETYDYGAYGELLTANMGTRRFLYNGQLGVVTDDNGLYHMRARYYNTDIKRFISRDIVSGDITNSQSLNRYCYVQGNPLSYVDPFGLSPLSILCEIGHGILMVLGFIPEWGFIADALNAIWYAAEKKPFEAFCSAVSAIPGAGDKFAAWLQAGKIGGKVFKNTKLVKTISHLMGNIGSLCIAGVNASESKENLEKALRGETYEGTILGNSIMLGLSILSGVLSAAGIIKGAKDLGNLAKPKPTIGSSSGLTIMARNSGKGNPGAITHFDVALNTRQSNLLNNMTKFDSSIVVPKKAVSLKDLAALTAKTGDEFAMFTRGSQRMIIRGNAKSVNINAKRAQELLAQGYKWSGHTHPGTGFNIKMPSDGDLYILKEFKQIQSVIYDSNGQFNVFGGY